MQQLDPEQSRRQQISGLNAIEISAPRNRMRGWDQRPQEAGGAGVATPFHKASCKFLLEGTVKPPSSFENHPPDLLIRETSGLTLGGFAGGRCGHLGGLLHRKGLPDGSVVVEPTFDENPPVASE